VTNYNEDGEDSFEEEEDDMTPNYWAAAPEEDVGPIIDKILDHRLVDPGTQFEALTMLCANSSQISNLQTLRRRISNTW
jgi:hypothetical protein